MKYHYMIGSSGNDASIEYIHDIASMFSAGMDREVPEFQFSYDGVVLNVGAGRKMIKGAIPIDRTEWDADSRDPIPALDGTVSTIHAYHFLEHVRYPVDVLFEFQRVLKPNGVVNIVVPYYNSQAMAQDLDHKHSFCEGTWGNIFSNPYYDKSQGKHNWKFRVGINMIMGLVERNLVLLTQLIKIGDVT